MVIKMDSIDSAHGRNSIGYGMLKLDKTQKKSDGLDELKPNENVLFLRADHINNNILDTPTPSDVYHQMRLRQQAAGFKRKDGFFRIEINPSKEEWKAMLGFDPVPGHLTDEQKQKILEVANKLLDDSIKKLDSTDHWGYRHNKKGEKYPCITGHHTKLADSQAVWSVHFDTDDIHIHGVANVVTENNEIQDVHMCKDRGFTAGDKVAEMRGWKTLDKYGNQRKERIHADGIDVLKNMKEFDLQKYFAEMMAKGWVVEPNSPDRNGIVHGYSVGEVMKHNDGSLSSVVMFKSSELGHSKDLTPSHLYKTWQKLQNEQQQAVTPKEEPRRTEQPKPQTATVVPIKNDKPAEGRWDEQKRKREEEEKRRAEAQKQAEQQKKNREQSAEEKEARSAVDKAVSVIDKFVHNTFNVYDRDEQADLLEGIVGQCMLGGRGSGNRGNLEDAVGELMDMVEYVAGQVEKSTALMMEIVAGLAMPNVSVSSGGGGGPTGGWRSKKDDDDWKKWKNVFSFFRSRSRGRQ